MSAETRAEAGVSEPAVEVRGLSKRFGRRVALDGMDMAVPRGSVYVLVGPNGAGKTTTLRILLDLVRADAGEARVLGQDTVSAGPRVRAHCGYLPERQDAGYGWMKVQQLLEHQARYRSNWDAVYAQELRERLEVRDHTKFGKLSKGEARRVQLVMALAHRPSLLLLDEPTDGLDPVMRDEAVSILSDHVAETGATLVISTHLVYEVEGLGDHLGVLKDGVLRAQLDRETLRRRLRRYTLEVPEGWNGVAAVNESIVRRAGRGREVAWTVWGDQEEVVERLKAGQAVVRDVEPLTLEEAAVALLAMRENQDRLSRELAPAAAPAEGR
ncbi:MAG TPA: ABC transporter ATP-binding protein [Longimicrobiales bacterium]|nr:ABC transporter ATP-binding protein [Longimicrobiales bacterium]